MYEKSKKKACEILTIIEVASWIAGIISAAVEIIDRLTRD